MPGVVLKVPTLKVEKFYQHKFLMPLGKLRVGFYVVVMDVQLSYKLGGS